MTEDMMQAEFKELRAKIDEYSITNGGLIPDDYINELKYTLNCLMDPSFKEIGE